MKHGFKIYRCIVLFLLTLPVSLAFAQEEGAKADSLISLLEQSFEDSIISRLNIEIASDLIFVDTERCKIYLDLGYQLAQQEQDSAKIARSLNLYGIVNSMQGRYLAGLEHYQKALTFYEATGDLKGASNCINNIGTIYSTLENDSAAIVNFKESYAMKIALSDTSGAALNLFNVAGSFISLEKYDSAMFYVSELRRIKKSTKEDVEDPAPLLGYIYMQRDQLDSAQFYYEKAYQIQDDAGDEYMRLNMMLGLAEVAIKRKQYTKANYYLKKIEDQSTTMGFSDMELELLRLKSDLHLINNNYASAYEYKDEFLELKDSLDMINNSSQLNELNVRYEAAKREKSLIEKDMIISEQEASKNAFIQMMIIVVASILAITIIVIIFLIKNRKKNAILNKQNKEIDFQQQKIIASINYAKKIQSSILVPEDVIRGYFQESFIFFKPKDIVSGDFYWFSEVGDKYMISTIDCTGHGVPGAFMSLIANSKMNKVVNEKGIHDPAEVLKAVHCEIVDSLNQQSGFSNAQDGMDMSLCLIDPKERKIWYAGAQNSIVLVRDNTLEEIKADSVSIGGTTFAEVRALNGHAFTTKELNYEPGTHLYMFTDGYLDQFGGEDGKKFNKRRFRKLLLEVSRKGLSESKGFIEEQFNSWRSDNPQLDDVLIIGAQL